MGHIVHHAIVVTSFDDEILSRAADKAKELGCAVTPVVASATNGYATFVICPDGSKSGWENSEIGDAQRDAFIEWARRQRDDDRSSPLEWVELQYGSDDQRATVVRHEWDDHTARDTANANRELLSHSRGGT